MPRALILAVAALLIGGAAGARADAVLGTCSWQERSDPALVNVLYPDADAVYYSARLPAPPPGIAYRIRGQFPHARYMSYVSYNGLPMDALLDADIAPDPGSINPFVPHADRTAPNRSYTVRLVTQREPGALYVGSGQLGTPAPAFSILYRVYVPDRGTDVPLPVIEVVGAGAPVDLTAVPCEGVRDVTAGDDAVQDGYAGASTPAPPAATPQATNPPTWSVETGLTAAVLERAGQGDLVSGGPASNPHNRYLLATDARAYGDVLAIRGKAPTTPQTYDGETRMGTGDLRYWSFCQNSHSTRYVACLSDSHIALDRDGWYTIAISDPSKRPPGARNWLPFGPEPEGQLLYRHMLPSARFYPFSAQGLADSGAPIEPTMGDYYPRAAYCSAARFERDACGLRPARP